MGINYKVKSAGTTWIVGFYDEKGVWNPVEDLPSMGQAQQECAKLNSEIVEYDEDKEGVEFLVHLENQYEGARKQDRRVIRTAEIHKGEIIKWSVPQNASPAAIIKDMNSGKFYYVGIKDINPRNISPESLIIELD